MNFHSYAMIIISVMAGLLSTMNIWVSNITDIRLHTNDFYMAFLMTGWMLLLQTIIFFNHIDHANVFIIVSILIIFVTFILIRTQAFVDDTQYINGMIPHHSMAILMSEKIKEKSNNKFIINLANSIIKSQQEEINFMNKYYCD